MLGQGVDGFLRTGVRLTWSFCPFVRFWGAWKHRLTMVRCGDNTPYLEIRCGDRLLIFDAGSGLRPFGLSLDRNGPVDGDLFFTHAHFDHLYGLPPPIHQRQNRFRLWSGYTSGDAPIREAIDRLTSTPLFRCHVISFMPEPLAKFLPPGSGELGSVGCFRSPLHLEVGIHGFAVSHQRR